MTDTISEKQGIKAKLAPDLGIMGEPVLLTGTEINTFAVANKLHLIETSMALGVNTAALYTKKSAEQMNSTLSLLLRIYSAFPEHLPRFKSPDVHILIAKIKTIDPTFKLTHLGPMLGLERNSSTRIKKEGLQASSPMVQQLAQLISLAIWADPQNWFVIKEAVELEAKARDITPTARVWREGGWSGKRKRASELKADSTPKAKAAGESDADKQPAKPISTIKPLVRRKA
ncbi:hypothetical protein [Pseudomonas sp.]|uniref:hypothetical protein n=1 Tax=Pseudomonas sp. TaxID=306 RepID=UPI002912C52B|nr:hypothetical protein [Pseudomonas sp.]MDU4254452.1 hypothetical protein [Pseudomonas sp.]